MLELTYWYWLSNIDMIFHMYRNYPRHTRPVVKYFNFIILQLKYCNYPLPKARKARLVSNLDNKLYITIYILTRGTQSLVSKPRSSNSLSKAVSFFQQSTHKMFWTYTYMYISIIIYIYMYKFKTYFSKAASFFQQSTHKMFWTIHIFVIYSVYL